MYLHLNTISTITKQQQHQKKKTVSRHFIINSFNDKKSHTSQMGYIL